MSVVDLAPAVVVMTHDQLVVRAAHWLRNTRSCSVVLSEVASRNGGEEPDAIGWTRGECIVIECKVTESDLRADRQKPFRQMPAMGLGSERWLLVDERIALSRACSLAMPGWGVLSIGDGGKIRRHQACSAMPSNREREIAILASVIARYQAQGISFNGWGDPNHVLADKADRPTK